jgi:hypothetical protein
MPTHGKYASNAERQAAYRARCSSQREKELSSKGLPQIPQVPSIPGHRRWKAMVGQACSLVESVTHEMETYYEERSEEWQESERGERFAEMMESIQEITAQIQALE